MAAATPNVDSKEGVAFLQERVAQFGLMAALLGGIFWVFRFALGFVSGAPLAEVTHPSFVLHGTGILFTLLLWLSCRGGPRPRRFVERAEVICLLASVFSYEGMGANIPLERRPELVLVLALTFVMLTRAIYVPSTARRTLAFGVVAGVPLVGVMFYAYGPGAAPAPDPTMDGVVAAFTTATWWSMSVTLMTATSRVIYGLRRQAREARQLGQYTLEEKIGQGAWASSTARATPCCAGRRRSSCCSPSTPAKRSSRASNARCSSPRA